MSAYARKVFLDGFLRNRDGFQLELPLVPLGELYGTRLESWLRDQGVTVHLKTGVRIIDMDEDGSACWRYATVRRIDQPRTSSFSLFPSIECCPWFPSRCVRGFPRSNVSSFFVPSPITGVHLWFDRPVCPFDHVVTPGRLIQWVFNHTAIQGRGVPRHESDVLARVTEHGAGHWQCRPVSASWSSARHMTLGSRKDCDSRCGPGGTGRDVAGCQRQPIC